MSEKISLDSSAILFNNSVNANIKTLCFFTKNLSSFRLFPKWHRDRGNQLLVC